MSRPRLALTIGDPAGIGPEVVVRALQEQELFETCDPVIVGPGWALEREWDRAGRTPQAEHVDVADIAGPHPEPGHVSAISGAWAMAALDAAARLAETGAVDGIVTAPVNKSAIHQAGHANFVGHTEYFGDRVGVPDPTMFFWSDQLCVSLATVHCALREVPDRLTTDRVARTIERTGEVLHALGETAPRIAVCGLNPHAGEDGLFGTEDSNVIAPAVEARRAVGQTVEGPLPGDTAFMRAGRGEFDAVVAMYHDQGLAPFKLVAFDSGVNVTLGLPYVRTSVDHGTALDIAGQGVADPSSMKAAIRLAARLVHATHSAR